RDPAVRQRAARRHEPRRAAADPPRLLRAARARAAGVLAAADRAAGGDGARTGAARLRDVDGREARARSRVDRRPLGAALPAHRDGHRLARDEAVAAGARIARRLIAAVAVVAACAIGAWLRLRPSPAPPREPHLLVGV